MCIANGKEYKMMKYEKATAKIIDLGEEEILTASGCDTAAFIAGDACGSHGQQNVYYNCTNKNHLAGN